MTRYLAADVYALLKLEGCIFEGDAIQSGAAWIAPGSQIFFLPEPDLVAGIHWFDSDVIDDNLRDRWVGFSLNGRVKHHD